MIVMVGRHANGIRRPLELSDFVTLQPNRTTSFRQIIERASNPKTCPKPGRYVLRAQINKINRIDRHMPGFTKFCEKHGLNPWVAHIESGDTPLLIVEGPPVSAVARQMLLGIPSGWRQVKSGLCEVPSQWTGKTRCEYLSFVHDSLKFLGDGISKAAFTVWLTPRGYDGRRLPTEDDQPGGAWLYGQSRDRLLFLEALPPEDAQWAEVEAVFRECGFERVDDTEVTPAPEHLGHAVAVPADDPRAGAKVELLLDKQEYFLGENVLLHYGVRNIRGKPFDIEMGGDYRGSPRALRFKVVATGKDGKQVEDPFPAVMNMGGRGGPRTLSPGGEFWVSLPLVRYCDFVEPGVYTVKVYHDLGWDGDYWDRLTTNALPDGPHIAPIVQTTIKLVMPTSEQARQVVDRMKSLPADPNAIWGRRTCDYQDFTALRQPVYLPIVQKLAQKGEKSGLTAIGAIVTPEATRTLVDLLDHSEPEIASEAMRQLLRRLPDPEYDRYAGWATEKRLSRRSWRDTMKPAVLSKGWDLLLKDDRDSLIRGARIARSLGNKDDFPRVLTALDRVLELKKDDPIEQSSYPRPVHATGDMIRAGWRLIERGVPVPAGVDSPGQAVLFMLAVGRRPDFRPDGWQDRASELLGHSIPYVRAVTLENLPKPPPDSLHDAIERLLDDDHLAVQVAACDLAATTGADRFQTPLLDLLSRSKDQWLLRSAHNAAIACGTPRDRVLEACINRLGEQGTHTTFFDLMIGVVETEGGYGYSQVDWGVAEVLQARWRRFVETNRQRIRASRRFKIAEPPLTPDLFPHGFQFHGRDGTAWPD